MTGKVRLSDRQIDCLKVLKLAPKTTAKAYDQLLKKNRYLTKKAIRVCMRGLEDRGLVRARITLDKKLNRDVIVWELTSQGRNALIK
jgi:repressor of nif and glnA expression